MVDEPRVPKFAELLRPHLRYELNRIHAERAKAAEFFALYSGPQSKRVWPQRVRLWWRYSFNHSMALRDRFACAWEGFWWGRA